MIFLNRHELHVLNALPYIDRLEVSDGSGPVDTLANAVKRSLVPSHPYLSNLELIDYKVRILDPVSATVQLLYSCCHSCNDRVPRYRDRRDMDHC